MYVINHMHPSLWHTSLAKLTRPTASSNPPGQQAIHTWSHKQWELSLAISGSAWTQHVCKDLLLGDPVKLSSNTCWPSMCCGPGTSANRTRSERATLASYHPTPRFSSLNILIPTRDSRSGLVDGSHQYAHKLILHICWWLLQVQRRGRV
jgi:hypothetical protein